MQVGQCVPADIELQLPPFLTWSKGVGSASLFDEYYSLKDAAIKAYPPRPSQYHQFDFTTESWLSTTADLDAAKADKKAEVEEMRQTHNAAPILYEGAHFDADAKAQGNVMSWMVNISNGLTVPPGFVWRDADNLDHPADEAFITGLGAAMVQRGSLLYQQAWQQKAYIDSLTSIPEVTNFTISFLSF